MSKIGIVTRGDVLYELDSDIDEVPIFSIEWVFTYINTDSKISVPRRLLSTDRLPFCPGDQRKPVADGWEKNILSPSHF